MDLSMPSLLIWFTRVLFPIPSGVVFFTNELLFDISFFCSPYFEVKHELDVKLQHQKQNVTDLHTAIKDAKIRYSKALGNLEKISEEIHQSRREKIMLMFPRQPGVGAESGSSLASAVPEINLGMLSERGVGRVSKAFRYKYIQYF